MVTSTITLQPEFGNCESKDLAEGLWSLFRFSIEHPTLRRSFRVLGPYHNVIDPSENGFVLPLSGGYSLVFEPEAEPSLAGEDDGELEIVAVGSGDVTLKPAPIPEDAAAPKLEMTVLADPDHLFAPLWDVTTNQLFCYATRLIWNGPDGRRISEQSLPKFDISPDQLLAVDLAAAERVVETVRQTDDAFGAGAFTIPVHPAIMNTAGDRWKSFIWSLALPVLDQIVFELVLDFDPPDLNQVETAVTHLQDFGRPILLRTATRVESLSWASRLPVTAFGFDGGPLAREYAEVPDFGDFCAAVEGGKAAYVLGLTSVASTAAAITAGFAFVGSDALSPSSHCEMAGNVADDPEALLRSLIARRSDANRI
ncbi:MAG: hypothetical protein MI741_22085 [Rhodospirillales bacterium]|nr:hypothetical protein [Rhodospirillales bacterium]